MEKDLHLHNYLNTYIKGHPAEDWIRRHWNIQGTLIVKNQAIFRGSEDYIMYLQSLLIEKQHEIKDLKKNKYL